MTDHNEALPAYLKHAWLWVLFTLILLPHHQLYNLSLFVLNLLAISLIFTRHYSVLFTHPAQKYFLLAFACIWLPMALSLTDAEHFRSVKTTLEFLRFPLVGLISILVIRDSASRKKLWIGGTVLCLFWAADGLIQYLCGTNLAGFPLQPGAEAGSMYVTGMFYPHFTLGHVLAILMPLYLEGVRRFFKQLKLMRILLAIPVIVAILLTGRRAAWIMLFLSMSGYAFYLWKTAYRDNTVRYLKAISLFTLLFLAISGAMYKMDDVFSERVDHSLPNPTNFQASMAAVTSLRTWIWHVATDMYQDHWINGVGPRGFRYVYSQYAQEDDPFAQTGQTHAHMTLLEIASETGTIGLIGYLGFFGILAHAWHRRQHANKSQYAAPLLVAVVVCIFPFNTAKAMYASFLATLLWWLLALYFAALYKPDTQD